MIPGVASALTTRLDYQKGKEGAQAFTFNQTRSERKGDQEILRTLIDSRIINLLLFMCRGLDWWKFLQLCLPNICVLADRVYDPTLRWL